MPAPWPPRQQLQENTHTRHVTSAEIPQRAASIIIIIIIIIARKHTHTAHTCSGRACRLLCHPLRRCRRLRSRSGGFVRGGGRGSHCH